MRHIRQQIINAANVKLAMEIHRLDQIDRRFHLYPEQLTEAERIVTAAIEKARRSR